MNRSGGRASDACSRDLGSWVRLGGYASMPEEVLKAHTRGSDGGSRCEGHQSYCIERPKILSGKSP